ncbi:MAG TPA: hypothetical protein VNZ27_09035 [Rhodanobacter sp.]|jgi:hypothetical protein|nr:hypothetical protein [Rhodanobacter sp.]
MHASTDVAPNADDVTATWSFRETLLAQNWPDSEAIGIIPGSNKDPGEESKASRDWESENNRIFGVWAGHDRGGYRFPPFQFLKGGLVNPKLAELMDALARRLYLHPDHDKSGWERCFWLYQPRGRLSVQALALHTAKFGQVQEDPGRFAALPNDARTPAEVFPDDYQAVIDLANEDADQQASEVSMMGEAQSRGES